MTTTVPGNAASKLRAFSMLELIVVISLIGLLAGVLAPIAFQSKKEAQAAKIVAVVDGLTRAVERFYADNGKFPKESTSTGATASHELLEGGASLPDWKGPYLLSPLTENDNPVTAAITLLDSLDASTITPAFSSLDGSGSVAIFYEIPEDVALIVNEILDGSEQGSGVNWKTAGRVTFFAGTSGGIQLMSPTGGSGGSGVFGSGGGLSSGGHGGGGGGGSGGDDDGSGAGSSSGGTSTAGGVAMNTVQKKGGSVPSQLNLVLSVGP